MAGAALLMVAGLAAPAAAHASAQPVAAGVTYLSAGRLGASVAAVVALIGVVVGGLALARPAGRLGTVVPLVAGLVGVGLGALVVATAEGGLGTGNGLGGGLVALVVGLIALVLGGLTLTRSRRTG
ncbi:hypothetical protein STVIR_4177 [Streptomyces viridochromogenes Tue57]|uniref:Integral membrane protein n=1 Tax=Streptomyces viridochromogenes Tue57 TaxID=1160705 RepID=L8PBN5_STRVR|nr:hypothetical protein STVIR_4177 [Streptomyces viridochromogenes Tue57]